VAGGSLYGLTSGLRDSSSRQGGPSGAFDVEAWGPPAFGRCARACRLEWRAEMDFPVLSIRQLTYRVERRDLRIGGWPPGLPPQSDETVNYWMKGEAIVSLCLITQPLFDCEGKD